MELCAEQKIQIELYAISSLTSILVFKYPTITYGFASRYNSRGFPDFELASTKSGAPRRTEDTNRNLRNQFIDINVCV